MFQGGNGFWFLVQELETRNEKLFHHIHLNHIRPSLLLYRHACQGDENIAGHHMAVTLEDFFHVGDGMIGGEVFVIMVGLGSPDEVDGIQYFVVAGERKDIGVGPV